MHITSKQAIQLSILFNINLSTNVLSFNDWKYALNVELEHGSKCGKLTNITNDNLITTAKIVIAHLLEFPDYYKRLRIMETNAEKYWMTKTKPNIFSK